MTTFRFYLLGLLALFGAYVALEYYRPKPLDWTPTLSNKDKIPYGTYALFDALPALLGTDSVESLRLPVYNRFFDRDEPGTNAETETENEVDSTRRPPLYKRTVTTTDGDSTTTATTYAPADEEADADADASASADAPDTTVAPVVVSRAETATEPETAADAVPQAPPTDTATESTAGSSPVGTVDEGESPRAALVPRLPDRATNYLFVSERFTLSPLEARALLSFVAAGNDVFIAAERFDGSGPGGRNLFTDSLGIRALDADSGRVRPAGQSETDSVRVRFLNPALGPAPTLRLPYQAASTYLAVRADATDPGSGPSREITALAADEQGRAVVLRLAHGRGHVVLCSVPLALSNYFLLPAARRPFALAALSYLPAGQPVWWDEYQKQGRTGEQSLLRVLLDHDALRWAYYLLLGTAALFIFIEARRRQRVIPVLKPLPNTTLLFTRTVASLYQQGSNHARIAEKKNALFLDYLRTRFQETQPDLADAAFQERLSQKAGLSPERVRELTRLINFARTAPAVSDRELLTLSRAIRDFKREAR